MTLGVENLSFSYKDRTVLDDISFTVHSGSMTAVLGPNGVGKSTLFKCILGLLTDYRGKVTISGTETKIWLPKNWRRWPRIFPSRTIRPLISACSTWS